MTPCSGLGASTGVRHRRGGPDCGELRLGLFLVHRRVASAIPGLPTHGCTCAKGSQQPAQGSREAQGHAPSPPPGGWAAVAPWVGSHARKMHDPGAEEGGAVGNVCIPRTAPRGRLGVLSPAFRAAVLSPSCLSPVVRSVSGSTVRSSALRRGRSEPGRLPGRWSLTCRQRPGWGLGGQAQATGSGPDVPTARASTVPLLCRLGEPRAPGTGGRSPAPGRGGARPRVVSLDVPGPPPGAVTLASTPDSERASACPGDRAGCERGPRPSPQTARWGGSQGSGPRAPRNECASWPVGRASEETACGRPPGDGRGAGPHAGSATETPPLHSTPPPPRCRRAISREAPHLGSSSPLL